MTLAFLHAQLGCQLWGPTTRGINHDTRGNEGSIAQAHAFARYLLDRLANKQFRAAQHGPRNKELCGARRIDHAIARYEQASSQPFSQLGLLFLESPRV